MALAVPLRGSRRELRVVQFLVIRRTMPTIITLFLLLFAVGLQAADFSASMLQDKWSVNSDLMMDQPVRMYFESTLTRDQLAKTPAWKEESEYPPLSPRKAEETALAMLQKIAGQRHWLQPDISLRAFDVGRGSRDIRWIYVLHFRYVGVMGFEGGFHNIIVLMDGTAIEPQKLEQSPPNKAERQPPQSQLTDVYSFRHQMPWGLLRKPLGTQIRITGEYDDQAKLTNVLSVIQIGGIYRGNPVEIEVRGVQLRKGIHYEFEGYEVGEFSGVPVWLHSSEEPLQYRSFFVVTKVVETKSTK